MAVKTKSIYEPGSPADGVRILITRFYPRGVKKDRFGWWEKRLSPSRELLTRYKSGGVDWKQFKVSFLKEMKSPDSLKALGDLRSLATDSDVTLLCYEKEGEHCHRQIVKGLVARKKTRLR